ncbi:hypothetical protein G6F57_002354 [Rhizopus arrhizus]|uniref:GST N-terminal domain-containing protein n=1 Tax=Rhizopus oryzae TaxID=64495 RepID=A0A9P7BQK0_RHIOR|nr:hypothetical protein G6F23_003250 [Rhizopus arrhizus]KAG1415391.1 hypothetical protein G6F58_006507 [Rhizopus delemar]KAG0762907.1 hypothetical protein G6F24_006428 [Rhizopus arrhizus]KAG0788908.1 hypothetical protein G6F22_006870 [Rhizopus arrhizus]KAG0789436.1 hypothetical protein G6F21_006517 [Rhizopus arrhizus]
MAEITYFDLEIDAIKKNVCSPNTAKTRFALNLKDIPYNTEWVTFGTLQDTVKSYTKTDKWQTVPTIVDKRNDKVVQDSWEIIKYLEEVYPDHPSVFNGNQGVHKFFHDYCDQNVMVPVFKMCLISLCNSCGEFKDYFRTDREITFKMTLEELAGQPEDHVPALKEGLLPIHQLLQAYPYITGDQAGWADIVLASHLNFMYRFRPDLFESSVLGLFDDDVLANWWKRTEHFRK